ncbi:hypothetical protein [Butyrivibrio proteoclasticus]|uniref:hypothetical protein n=1 Tax=Butyrivibrio proteoclasticus TaxID=43305 RepID=UPI0004787E60|nr:hypothetical protein [Butyrivibrio proteoclasticus]
MSKFFKCFLGFTLSLILAATIFAQTSYAYSDRPEYFDFGDTVISMNAGTTREVWFRSVYDYTYYVGDHTSSGTYVECTYKGGTENIVIHIGADETVKNVFFHFYVLDERVHTEDVHDCIEVYVQNIQTSYPSIQAPIAGGKTGSLSKNGNVAMLYNQNGTAMASFSLSLGNGNMASLGIKGIVNNGSNYFDVISGSANATPVISESDKQVMIANGYAGVCVNGVYKNWP